MQTYPHTHLRNATTETNLHLTKILLFFKSNKLFKEKLYHLCKVIRPCYLLLTLEVGGVWGTAKTRSGPLTPIIV